MDEKFFCHFKVSGGINGLDGSQPSWTRLFCHATDWSGVPLGLGTGVPVGVAVGVDPPKTARMGGAGTTSNPSPAPRPVVGSVLHSLGRGIGAPTNPLQT